MSSRILFLSVLVVTCLTACSGGENGASDVSHDSDAVVDSSAGDSVGDLAVTDVHMSDSGEVVPSDAIEADSGDEVADMGDAGPGDVNSDGSDAGPLPGFVALAAAVACSEPDKACGGEPTDKIFSSYRKDYYLDKNKYITEIEDAPVDGGRFHIQSVSKVTGTVTGVFINDEPVEQALADLRMDWRHVWPPVVETGKPLWFAFHSRDAAWDTADKGTIKVETDNGVAMEGEFRVGVHPFVITYVTTSQDMTSRLIFVKNESNSSQTVTSIYHNGIELLSVGKICVPKVTLEAGETALWTVPLCEPEVAGSAWTVGIEFESLPPTGVAGRTLRPFFPIEAWQKGEDCPLPGVNDEAHETFTQGGIDTFYLYWGTSSSCGYDNAAMFNEVLPGTGTYGLLGDDWPWDQPPFDVLLDTSAVAGVLTGDESDWEYVTDDGKPKPETKATRSRTVWEAYPELTTYNGAMTSEHVGAFAGMTDIQGIDVYSAGCAPHILKWGDGPPLEAPYEFLKNARNNHMPWPTWLYSQGMGNWSVMPDPQELLIQGIQVLLAGGKGLMWFQVGMDYVQDYPDTWQGLSDVNWMVRGVRNWVRAGDLTGLAKSDPKTSVDAIRSVDAMVVPVVSLDFAERPTDDLCLYHRLGVEPKEPHWIMNERKVEITVTVPDDFAVVDLFEVRPGAVEDVVWPVYSSGRTYTIREIPLDNTLPSRVFVFASQPTARQQALDAMDKP